MNLDHIRRIELFAQVSEPDLIEINKLIAWNKYPRNLSILNHYEESTEVYFISYGQVKATSFSLSGKEIAYQALESGRMFGELSSLDNKQRSTSVVVTQDSIIGKMSSKDFWKVMNAHHEVSSAVLLRLTELVRFLCGRVYEFGALGVSDRIRSEILRHAKDNSNVDGYAVIESMPTHEEIANRVSTHREAVTKEFSYLYKQGYIEKSDQGLIVPDTNVLQALIDETTM